MKKAGLIQTNKIKCHSRMSLSGISTAFNNAQGGDPRLQASGMTSSLITRRGFTLMELLVVVLIIGILAAIALPQYQKAIEKSRVTEALFILSHIQKATDLWILDNGGYPLSGTEIIGNKSISSHWTGLLDIDIEKSLNCNANNGDWCASRYFAYDEHCTSSNCQLHAYRFLKSDYSDTDQHYWLWLTRQTDGSWKKYCYIYDKLGENICKTLQRDNWTVYDKR